MMRLYLWPSTVRCAVRWARWVRVMGMAPVNGRRYGQPEEMAVAIAEFVLLWLYSD